jgi:putative endonuclease
MASINSCGLKKWRRDWKVRLIEEQNPDWRDLYPMIVR